MLLLSKHTDCTLIENWAYISVTKNLHNTCALLRTLARKQSGTELILKNGKWQILYPTGNPTGNPTDIVDSKQLFTPDRDDFIRSLYPTGNPTGNPTDIVDSKLFTPDRDDFIRSLNATHYTRNVYVIIMLKCSCKVLYSW